MKIFGLEITRALPPPAPEEEEEWHKKMLLHFLDADDKFRTQVLRRLLPDLRGEQDVYEANFFGYRAAVLVTPHVKEPVLLVPSHGEQQFENYVRNRFGGPRAQVLRRSSKRLFENPGDGTQEGSPSTYVEAADNVSLGSKL